ncbi:3-hydroxyacyl-CoA dehydrogenase [Streptomyces sp. NPDC054796]
MRIRIVGAGVMGRGIAQWAATAGHTVELADARQESVTEAREFVRGMLERAVAKGRTSEAEASAALERLVPLESPYAAPADDEHAPALVVEAVREDLETKAGLFTELEKVLPAATVFATNTSSLSVTEIGARLADPSRLAGLHFFNPVPLMRIAEVVPGAATRADIPGALTEFVEQCGHRAVTVADTPGFLVNHAGRGLVTEALALLEENVAEPAALDRIARDVLGLRMGPFELMDLTGLDVTASVIDTVWRGFRHADRLRPSYLTANRVVAGLHGRKTGRGWYAYGEAAAGAAASDAPAEGPQSGDTGRAVTVAGEGAAAGELRALLAASGARLDEADPRALLLVPTWGTTVADAVERHGLDAGRTLGVDPLSLATPRRVLAVTPASAPEAVRDAVAVLAATGGEGGGSTEQGTAPARVTVVRDTAGSVAQRLLASIVGVAASIAERAIATPADIDLAVTLGLGYPHGPLAWGERVGAARLLGLQRALHATTGDPRYRPTRWVTERAQLGLPLTAPDAPLP